MIGKAESWGHFSLDAHNIHHYLHSGCMLSNLIGDFIKYVIGLGIKNIGGMNICDIASQNWSHPFFGSVFKGRGDNLTTLRHI
jgi:hypothetical protein